MIFKTSVNGNFLKEVYKNSGYLSIQYNLISVYVGECKLCSKVNQISCEQSVLFAFKCCFTDGLYQTCGLCFQCLQYKISTKAFFSIF